MIILHWELLRDTSYSITMDRYVHVIDDISFGEMNKIECILNVEENGK